MSIQTDLLIEGVARGAAGAHNLLSIVKQGSPLTFRGNSAKFVKVKPGVFEVYKAPKDGEEVKLVMDTPTEAKMEVITFLANEAKKTLPGAQ